jgi:hypothetical protein
LQLRVDVSEVERNRVRRDAQLLRSGLVMMAVSLKYEELTFASVLNSCKRAGRNESTRRRQCFGRFVDRVLTGPVKYGLRRPFDALVSNIEESNVSLVKIIVITVLIILSILFLGRFFI